MKILSIDTAMNGCSAGVVDMTSGVLSSMTDPMTRGHAERLVPLIQEALVKARCDFPDIGLIATSVGPGAFTGLRIGLSTARALGLALNIPVIGVTTLAALAAAYFGKQPESGDCLILIETKRTDFYGQMFSAEGNTLSEPFALPADAIAEMYLGDKTIRLIGDANQRFLSLIPNDARTRVIAIDGYEVPDPACIARIGYALHESGAADSAPEPLYLRGADVSQSSRPQRVIED